jgi:hypothetical protein
MAAGGIDGTPYHAGPARRASGDAPIINYLEGWLAVWKVCEIVTSNQ